jgi:hypothetical protein
MNRSGLSTFISTALITLISLIGILLAINIVKPVLDRTTDNVIINEGFQNLGLLNDIIHEVASEDEGSKRTINIKISDGELVADTTIDYLNFSYKTKSDLNFTGQRGNINITRMGDKSVLFVAYSNVDLVGMGRFGKGENSVVIENEGINTGINKPMINISK